MGNRYDMMEDSYGLFREDIEAPEELNPSGGRHPNPWASEVGDHLQAEGVRRSLERPAAARFHLVRVVFQSSKSRIDIFLEVIPLQTEFFCHV